MIIFGDEMLKIRGENIIFNSFALPGKHLKFNISVNRVMLENIN